MTETPARPRITWEQFARAAKFLVAIAWGTCEMAFWGGRAGPLAFIGLVLTGTESRQAWLKVRSIIE